ncbi:MAG: hypothetical protein B7Y05_14430 [Polynucleobacter sp. 24-46-87]|jgi:hypothetical protein|uniref:hypothetical protein n=1 Tax=Hydrogenophaga sp. TaxID=1904254 RepID=UPI000BDB9E46|nr:hypothetical protein [Hydrogenophaga sp.]MDP1959000.1 hypothetical protein [Methylotenera sp.]MDP3885442.1 hypothetical protein [Hydrogenophaga sp.]OZA11552.1 MAG: hypothetical protein B7Y05_14430 [Polynucleobacter sp. 24-46-87]
MKKTASLGTGLIATKGKAAPSTENLSKPVNHDKDKRIAITVKLLEGPYLKMKAFGALKRKSNQDILEQALNEYLEKVGNT